MPPRHFVIPRSAFASHCKHLRQRCKQDVGVRFASTTSTEVPLWRGQDPVTRLGQSITGAQEWQTSTYSFNKQNTKTLPVAATNVEKLIEAYVTMKQSNQRRADSRAARAALAIRRKSAEKVYVSKPRVKDFGDRLEMTAFVYDGKEGALENETRRPQDQKGPSRRNSDKGKEESVVNMLVDPAQKAGLESLIARIYNKPVDLTLVKLNKPHLDAEILAAVVAQRLRDRRNTPRRVIRDATWRAPLPSEAVVAHIQHAKAHKLAAGGTQLKWQDMTLGSVAQTTAGNIAEGLGLSQVSSVAVEAAGRLTKRLTANRSTKKMARRGANAKGPGYMLRGFRKAHTQYAFASGKRRVGQYGIKVSLGHT